MPNEFIMLLLIRAVPNWKLIEGTNKFVWVLYVKCYFTFFCNK